MNNATQRTAAPFNCLAKLVPARCAFENEKFFMSRSVTRRDWWFVFAGIVLFAGCGEGGPVRYQVSGKVRFQGKLVPAGSVVFTPDSSHGNSGPQGVAEIVNGSYSTTSGVGTVGGPHTVLVIATDANQPAQDAETNGPLANYTFELDLPKEPFEHDIEIP